jgi:RNA polymerase sigma factor (sigma-70 family)
MSPAGSVIIAGPQVLEPQGHGRCITGERVPLEDQELIRLAQGGDTSAFEELVRRYQEPAFRAAYLVLRDAPEAEDAAQDAFVKAYRALHRFRTGSMRPWLLKIVMNESLNRAKSRRRRIAVAERAARQGEPPTWTMDDTVIGRERAALLRSALDALREQDRTVIYLRYFLMLSEQELAEYLGCAPGTVKSRLHRALGKLRDVVVRGYPGLMAESV